MRTAYPMTFSICRFMSRGVAMVLLLLLLVTFGSPAFSQSPESPARVNVRHADHPGYSRIVFDWPGRVDYTPVLEGDRLTITFAATAVPDWNGLPDRPLRHLAAPTYHLDDGALVVAFTIPRPGDLRHFRDGTKIAFDIREPQDGGTSITQNAAQNKAAREAYAAGAEAVTAEPLRRDDDIDRAAPSAGRPVLAPQAPESDRLIMTASRRDSDINLHYPWPKNVPAAAFVRHNRLWVIFADKKAVDHGNLARFLGQRVFSARQLDHPAMTVLTYEVAPGQEVKMKKNDTAWELVLQGARVVPARPIATGHQRAANNRDENFFFAVDNAGPVVFVEDPVIGDELAVIPVSESSQGMVRGRKFIEFESLATAQGIAVQLIADNLEIVKYRNGVSVTAKEGLALSRSRLSSKLSATMYEGEAEERQKEEEAAVTEKLFDFAAWAKGPLEGADYHANKHELLYRLATATDSERNELRWTLARFYLGNGHKTDAYGVLSVMRDTEPDLMKSANFRAVLGVTNILMRRFEEGDKLLSHKSLVAERDTFLWRTVANSELGNHARALANFKKGSDILSLHAPRDRARFLFAAIRSAYAIEDRDFVKSALSILNQLPLEADQLSEANYWQAQLERDDGNRLKAEETLQAVVNAGFRETAAWAKLDLINLQFDMDKIDATEAVDQLEKLRFAWRGDDFELDLLSRLGDVYVSQKEYNIGLQTLKQAVTFFQGTPKTGALTRQMSEIYTDLFLKEESKEMDPIKAVALYSEFRELIPLGADGDTMTRQLADRLVTMDLLEEAAELLEYQIKFRLEGVAQSVVASRLAMIYLLDSKPDKALGILRATRDSQIPQDIEDRRRMIETRTLIELGRYEEAEVLLSRYKTPEAEELRADIYWRSENWPDYIAHGTRMLNNRYQDDTPLTLEERLAVLRLSVAYVISDDAAGVKTLRDRYKAHMDNGHYGDTFEVITAERQLTDQNVRRLTKSIASVAKLETFMESYKAEFANN